MGADRDGLGPASPLPTPGAERRPASIPTSRAVALGLVQGPAELLPVSSSAHLSLIPWLAGWEWRQLDPELRKSFEVALHVGGAAALLVGQRRVIADELRSFEARKASVLALSFLPAGACGLIFERQIERRLGGPLPTALGLLAGAIAMVLSDRRPQRLQRARAGPADGLALGLAQAAALAPGISRNGATLTAARWRGFTRRHSNMLSRTVALPVIVGAAALKATRLRRRGLAPEQRPAFAWGMATSFASTLASQILIRLVERDSALWPYAAYRAGLAAVVLTRAGRMAGRARRQGERVVRGEGRSAGAVSGNGRPAAIPISGSGYVGGRSE